MPMELNTKLILKAREMGISKNALILQILWEWIEEAEKRGIGWWITSALESNIGLNAIAQWCATWQPHMPQGLGTGLLFTDNVPMPLEIRKDCLWYVADRHQ